MRSQYFPDLEFSAEKSDFSTENNIKKNQQDENYQGAETLPSRLLVKITHPWNTSEQCLQKTVDLPDTVLYIAWNDRAPPGRLTLT